MDNLGLLAGLARRHGKTRRNLPGTRALGHGDTRTGRLPAAFSVDASTSLSNIGRGQTAVAGTAAKILDVETVASRDELVALSRSFDRIGTGLSMLLERGAKERYYFVAHHTRMA